MSHMTLKLSLPLLMLCCACAAGSVPLRPDGRPVPQPCPPGALEAMLAYEVKPGDGTFLWADATQRHILPALFLDGPVVGYMDKPLRQIPVGTRLYGRVWTSGPEVVIRYHEAHLPDGRRIPFCAIATDGGGGLVKQPESKPGTAVLHDSGTALDIVAAYP